MGFLAAGLAAAAAGGGGGGGGGGGSSGGGSAPVLPTILGRVADGYVSGARIYIDTNNNGIADASEFTGVVTDSQGNFSVKTSATGAIIAVGGVNIDTGLPNEMVLKAPAGSTAVNPLTTVLQEYVEANPAVSVAAAQAAVKTALGIPASVNLTTYDPLAATDPLDPIALGAQKVASQIAAVSGMSGGNGQAVLDNIVGIIGQGQKVDLTDTVVLKQVFNNLTGVDQVAVEAATDAISLAQTLDPAGIGSVADLARAALDHGNSGPVILSASTAQVDENAAVGTNVFKVTAVDAEGDPFTYSLVEDAGGRFVINPATGQVSVAGAVDYELTKTLQISVQASDGKLGDRETHAVTIAVTNLNDNAPKFSSTDSVTITENSPAGTVLTAATTDADGNAVVLSLDQAFGNAAAFTFNAATGALSLNQVADFESLSSYSVKLRAFDGVHTTEQTVVVGVTDVNEPPAITSGATATVAENLAEAVYQAAASDPEGKSLTFTLAGPDATAFSIDSSGRVTFLNAADFESTVDANGDSVYSIEVRASDGTNTTAKAVAISVSDVNETPAFTSGATASVAENLDDTVVYEASAQDPEGASLTYSLTGTDAAAFSIDSGGKVTMLAAADFESPADADGDGVYSITVEASDGTYTTAQDVAVSVTDVNEAPTITSSATASVRENLGDTVVYETSAQDPEGASLTYTLAGADAAAFSIDSAGKVTLLEAADFEAPADTDADGVYEITVQASDGTSTATQDVAVTVTDTGGSPFSLAFDGSTTATGTVVPGTDVAGWEYSTDGGATFTQGEGTSFEFPASTDLATAADSLQVRETYADGGVSDAESALSSLTVSSSADVSASIASTRGIDEITAVASGSGSTATADVAVNGSVGNVTVTAEGEDSVATVDVDHFTTSTDEASYEIALPFAVRFGGVEYTSVFLNSNSYLTFGEGASQFTGFADYMEVPTILVSAADNSIQFHSAAEEDDGDTFRIRYEGTYGTSGTLGASDIIWEALFHKDSPDQIDILVGENASGDDGGTTGLWVDSGSGLAFTSGSFLAADSGMRITEAGVEVLDSADGLSAGPVIDPLALNDSVIEVTASGSGARAEFNLDNGTGDIASLSVTASGASSEAYVDDFTVDGNIGEFALLASGDDSEASAYLYIEQGLGAVTVSATGASSYADAAIRGDTGEVILDSSVIAVTAESGDASESHLYVYDATGSIESLTVWASGVSSEASAEITIDGSIGDVTLRALGENSTVVASLSGDVTFDASVVEVTASANYATAELDLDNPTGSIASLEVTASGEMSEKSTSSVDFDLDGSLGDISVAATTDGAQASVWLGRPSYGCGDVGSLELTASVIEATANGADASADLTIDDAVGSIESLLVTVDSGNNALADADIDINGSVGDITVTASGASSDASAIVSGNVALEQSTVAITSSSADSEAYLYIYGGSEAISSIEITASGKASDAWAEIETDGSVGAITVDASGDETEAYAHIAGDSGDVTADASVLNVTASGTYSEARLYLNDGDATGSIESLTVTASGNSSGPSMDAIASAEIYFDGAMSDMTVLASGTSADAVADISGDVALEESVIDVTAECQDANAELEINGASGTIASISVTATGTVEVLPNYSNDIGDGGSDQYDNGNYLSSEFSSDISYAGGEIVEGRFGEGSRNVVVYDDSIFAMLVTGNTSDTFSVSGNLGADGSGSEDVAVLGEAYNGFQAIVQRTWGDDPNINRVFIYQEDSATTFAALDGDTDNDDFSISGLAGVDTFGYAVVYGTDRSNPIGTAELESFFHSFVDNVLTSEGEAAALETMQSQFSANQSALRESLPALYPGFEFSENVFHEAYASVEVGFDFDGTVAGSIEMDAGDAGNSNLHLYSENGQVIFASQDISVTASGYSADAELELDVVGGHIASLTVTASGANSDASADIYANSSGELEVGAVNVTASGYSAEAELELNITYGGIDSLSITASGDNSDASADISLDGTLGDITVLASGRSSDASADIYSSGFGQIILDSSEASITASGFSSEAELDLEDATGSMSSLSITASGVSSEASAYIDFSSSESNGLGDITVDASGTSGDAHADISGSVVLDESVIVISASGEDAYADMDLSDPNGTIASIDVVASGDSSHASTDFTMDGSVGDITLDASGDYARADLGISRYAPWSGDVGTLTLTDSVIEVTASGVCADAELDLTNASGTIGDITVNAGGEVSNADVSISGVSGNLELNASIVDVTASGEYASADLYIEGAAGSIRSLSVTASDTDSNASADLYIDGSVGDTAVEEFGVSGYQSSDISVEASGAGSVAYAGISSGEPRDRLVAFDISGDGGTSSSVSMTGIDIDVSATGTDAVAELHIDNASGSIGSLNVKALAKGAQASADIQLTGSVENVTFDSDFGAGTNASIDQTDSGGSVSVAGNGYAVLHYAGATANSVVDGDRGSLSLVDIEVYRDDASRNPGSSADVSALSGEMMTVSGFSLERDSIRVGDAEIEEYSANTSEDAGDFAGFLSDAFAELDAYADAAGEYYYFGVAGGDGYLAYDYDGQGITGVIKLEGVTTFDEINVTQAQTLTFGSDESSYTDTPTVIDSLTVTDNYGYGTSVDLTYENARIGDVDVYAYNGLAASADVAASDTGTLVLRQSDVALDTNAYSRAVLDIGNASGSIVSLGVTAAGTRSYGSVDIRSFDGALGDVTLQSSGTSSDVYAGVSGDVALEDSVIDVTASSADAHAELELYGASGSIESLAVTASGDNSDASADISIEGTVGKITVEASGVCASADVQIDAAEGSIESLTITASAHSSDASADISITGSVGDISVSASGMSSDAYGGISGDVTLDSSTLTVTASNYSADAVLNVSNATDSSINSLTVTASGTSSIASADISMDGSMGDIAVEASGDGADADVQLDPDSATSFSLLRTSTPASYLTLDSVLTATASGSDAEANLGLSGASGTIRGITVNAAPELHAIDDGGSDQYDSGNSLASQFESSIPYSQDEILSGLFGNDSRSVVVYQDSIFAALVTGNTSDTFTVSGNVGSDGSGSEDIATLGDAYNGFQAIVQRTWGDDPSINRVFIYREDAAVTYGALDGNTNTDDLSISGLAAVPTFAYAVVYGADDLSPIDTSQLETLFHAFVDNVLTSGTEVASLETMQSQFYANQEALRDPLPALYEGFDIGTVSSATASADIEFTGSVSGAIDVEAGDAGYSHLNLYSNSGQILFSGTGMSATASGENSDAELTIGDASGSIGSVEVDATGSNAFASADISIDGSIDYVYLSATGSSSDIDVTLTAGSILDIEVEIENSSTVDLTLNLGAQGGTITVVDEPSAVNSANITYLGNYTSDTIDLGGFSGNTTHLTFGVEDLDGDWADVSQHTLVVDGVTAVDGATPNLALEFSGMLSGWNYAEDETPVDLAAFQTAATGALSEAGGNEFYFGVVGDTGYLAYDFDNVGVTGLIELPGVTQFDSTQIEQLI